MGEKCIMRQTHAEFHNKRCQRILGKLRKRSLKACIVDLTKQSYSVNERRWNPQSNFIGYVLSPKWSKHDLKMYYLVKDVYKTFHQSSNIAKICCLADLIILIHVLDSYWFPHANIFEYFHLNSVISNVRRQWIKKAPGQKHSCQTVRHDDG